MSLWKYLSESMGVSFPRVSGDEPLSDLEGGGKPVFSPRERG